MWHERCVMLRFVAVPARLWKSPIFLYLSFCVTNIFVPGVWQCFSFRSVTVRWENIFLVHSVFSDLIIAISSFFQPLHNTFLILLLEVHIFADLPWFYPGLKTRCLETTRSRIGPTKGYLDLVVCTCRFLRGMVRLSKPRGISWFWSKFM